MTKVYVVGLPGNEWACVFSTLDAAKDHTQDMFARSWDEDDKDGKPPEIEWLAEAEGELCATSWDGDRVVIRCMESRPANLAHRRKNTTSDRRKRIAT
jgi:hypothetical protein